ncbi:MAG TPA: hypothetical protein VFX30_12015 [bacterium]|nr:hypothetical protein [bacterium]
MTEDEGKPETEGKSVYLGNAVPKLLRLSYAAFALWALSYVVRFLVPDLVQWLKR